MVERSFEKLVKKHHRAVATYARSMTSSTTIAEDATQETFLRAWKYLDSFRGSGSFEGWLIRICRHCVHDLAAREARSGPPAVSEMDIDLTTQPADYQPETMMLLDGLSPDHREVLVLCGLLGYDYETASMVLDLPVGTIRSRLSRARSAMSRTLLASQHEKHEKSA